ncbi:MAG: virB8 family protein [Sedimentibacter sp.]
MGILGFGKKANQDDEQPKKEDIEKAKAEKAEKKQKQAKGEKASIHASNEIVELMKQFESSKMADNEKSKKNAWKITYFFGFLSALSVGAVMGLAPLKETVPYVLRVDNNTGFTDVVKTLKNAQSDYGEEVSKYFLGQYVKTRESYDWFTIDDAFKTMLLQSGDAEQNRLKTVFSRPDAPYKIHKDHERVFIDINNISFLNKSDLSVGASAQVRYTKRVEPTNGGSYDPNTGIVQPEPKITKYVATIVYEWRNPSMNEDDRLKNPLGFTVISYRNDVEMGQ